MKRLLIFLAFLFLFAQIVSAQGVEASRIRKTTFANLGAPADSNVRDCIDCSITAGTGVCASGGTGATATRRNGTWYCSTGGTAGTAGTVTSVSGTANQIDVATGTTTPVLSLPTGLVIPGSLSSAAANPADAGVIRLGNAECVEWEKAVSGTDWTLCLNASDQLESTAPVKAPSFVGSGASLTALPYDVAMSYSGVPGASAVIRVVVPRAFASGSSWAGSLCSAAVAATAQADFILAVNGVTKLTLRFAAAGTTCSLQSPTTVTFAAGDVITITSPGTPDATLADIAISLKGSTL